MEIGIQDQFEPAKDGNFTIRIHDSYLESPYNPKRNASRFIPENLTSTDVPVFLGSGMGYHINECFLLNESKWGILVEREVDCFAAALSIIEPSVLSRLVLFVGEQTKSFEEFCRNVELERIVIVRHPRSVRFALNYYLTIEKLCHERHVEVTASRVTETQQTSLWTRNILKNLSHLGKNHYGTIALESAFSGPALLVASGPSVEYEFEWVSALQKGMPLISLLPSLPFLLKHGITPDAVLTTDAGFWNRERFRPVQNLPLFTTYSVDPVIFREWLGDVYLFSHGLQPERDLQLIRDRSLEIPMQGTSSIVMILLARKLGFSPLYCAGFDFSFFSNKDHHCGAGFDRYYIMHSNRFSTWDTQILSSLISQGVRKIGHEGRRSILSTHKLILYKRWLRQIVDKADFLFLNQLQRNNPGSSYLDTINSGVKLLNRGVRVRKEFRLILEQKRFPLVFSMEEYERYQIKYLKSIIPTPTGG